MIKAEQRKKERRCAFSGGNFKKTLYNMVYLSRLFCNFAPEYAIAHEI